MKTQEKNAALDEALKESFPASDPVALTSLKKEEGLHRTKNALEHHIRTQSIGNLQAHLADAIDLTTQVKQAHWNIKGVNFIALHELFDRIYSELAGYSDIIAERLVALGGQAYGTAREAAKRSSLSEYPLEITASADHVEAISSQLAAFGKTIRDSIETTADNGDPATSDVLTEVSRGIDKVLWFVESHRDA